jgi:hypothetical protein
MTPRVFLCEPSGLAAPQRLTSDRWHERLFGLGLDIDQLREADYEPDPWPGLMTRVRAAHGVLVLGFRQLHISTATWRPGVEGGRDLAGSWTSPWLQIEVGLAVAVGLPLLVVPEAGVREGVFAPETWAGTVLGTSMSAPDDDVIDSWARSVGERFASRVS